LAFIKEPNLK